MTERIATVAELEAIYGIPAETALVKVRRRLTAGYRTLIEASPFCVLANAGPDGLDASPRGDAHGLVRVVDDATLMMPDRRGNNRIDSLRNIVGEPHVALLFLIPGLGQTLRVNGRAHLTAEEDVVNSFTVDGKRPRSVIVIAIDEVYFQCSRAVMRAQLWDSANHVDPARLLSAGSLLAECSGGRVGGADYDAAWPARARESMW
jgi:PPOX class probable FMN-dependent enzyme